MKFTTHENLYGTSLQGYVTTTYAKLVEIFGEPEFGGDKVTASWSLQFEDGTVATIYDWKMYETPMEEYRWHIGGKNYDAVARVLDHFTDVKV